MMTRGKFLVGAVATTLAIGVSPALAQRTSSGGDSSGSAVSRGGDSGGGATSRGSDSSPSSSSGSSSGSSSSGGRSSGESYSAPSAPAAREYVSAPMRPSERAERAAGAQRNREGGGSGEAVGRAVPRGESGSRGASEAPGRSATASTSSEGSNPSNRAVPAYSRPRDGRPQTGTAVERMTPRPDGNIYPYVPYYGSYYGGYYGSGRYYWPGSFGLGFYYDPLWYDPFFYDPLGAYYGGGYGNPYGGYQGGYGAGSYSRVGTGSVRLKIKPHDAQVYVDGYFVGTVDQFDGLFQKLSIDGGSHRIEIRAEGHETIQFDVLITPGETVTYKGELKRIQ